MKKKVRRVTIALVMTLLMGCVGLVVTLGFFADQAIESAIEVAGSEALGLCLEIAEVDLSLFSGSLSLRGLVIDNPDGYQHKKLLELESGLIQIRIKSLMADTIFIKIIKLKGVDLVVEQKGLTSNLQEVMDMIEMSKATELARKKLEIDVLEISDIRVRVKLLPVLGKMGTVTLKLPPIRMTDLGKSEDLDVGTLSAKVIVALFGDVMAQGLDVVADDLAGSVFKTLGAPISVGMRSADEVTTTRAMFMTAGHLVVRWGISVMEVPAESDVSGSN